jgi:hypothetical protein
MATIRARRQSNGSTRYTAYVRIRRGKSVVHTEAKSFSHRSAALTWARHREILLANPSALTHVQQGALVILALTSPLTCPWVASQSLSIRHTCSWVGPAAGLSDDAACAITLRFRLMAASYVTTAPSASSSRSGAISSGERAFNQPLEEGRFGKSPMRSCVREAQKILALLRYFRGFRLLSS